MVKPSLGGSSVGMSLVHDRLALPGALGDAWATDPSAILIEEYIPGLPVTVGLLELPGGVLAFPPSATQVHSGEWYDADAKLNAGGTATVSVTVADLPDVVTDTLIGHAHALWDALGCHGMARMDFIVTASGQSFALEVNTTPGMSRQSNFVIGAASCGLKYNDLVLSILREASTRRPYDVPLPHPVFSISTWRIPAGEGTTTTRDCPVPRSRRPDVSPAHRPRRVG
jgi:D-alanine-D-alanine ligase